MEIIEHPPIFRLPGIPDHVTYTWLVLVILSAVAFVASRNLQLVPRGAQNLLEVVLEQFQGLIDDVIGHEGRPYRSRAWRSRTSRAGRYPPPTRPRTGRTAASSR